MIQKNKKDQIDSMLELLDNISNKQRADIYKRKYLEQKKILDQIKPMVGL